MELIIIIAPVIFVLCLIGYWAIGENTENKPTVNTETSTESMQSGSDTSQSSTKKEFKFRIAGISYNTDTIIEMLGDENAFYEYNKKELIEEDLVSEKQYEYTFPIFSNVQLVDEPENEFDSKALRVDVDGIKIGYIKKGSTTRVRNLINTPTYKSNTLEISGGNYKVLLDDFDDFDDNPTYTIEKGNDNLYGILTIYTVLKD